MKRHLALFAATALLAGATVATEASAGNKSFVRQYGHHNGAAALQKSTRKIGRILQRLDRKRAYGSGNYAWTSQNGGGNVSVTRQQGTNNVSAVAQLGRGHTASHEQVGSNNSALTIQVGRNQTSHTRQIGSGNSSVVVQSGW